MNETYIEDPITGEPLVRFRIKPGGLRQWSGGTKVVRKHREVTIENGIPTIRPGKWKCVEPDIITGYIIEGYNPLKKEWIWIDTEDNYANAELALKRWKKALLEAKHEL